MSENPNFHVAFNTLLAGSTAPVDAINPSRGTREMANRSGELVRQLEGSFDYVSVSVIPGRMIDLLDLAARFTKLGITVSSVDVPDVQSLPQGLGLALGSAVKGDLGLAKNHVGWTLANTGSMRQQGERTHTALSTFAPSDRDSMQIVKASASFWAENPRQGEHLEEVLQKYRSETGREVGLAIEIWAEGQTPAQYQAFLDRLRVEQNGRDPAIKSGIYADLDLGHLERSRARRSGEVIDPATKILEDVMGDPRRAKNVKIVSLNQYKEGDRTHERFDDGIIDLRQAAHILGRSMKEGKAEGVTSLIEAYPSHYDWFMSNEGLVYCQSLQQSFNSGAGK
jgi:hypothetical protein